MLSDLCELVDECFKTDDGSLPTIRITNLSADGVASIYAMLRQRSRIVSDTPEFWSLIEEVARPVDSVPNAAALVASGKAEPFHIAVGGLVSLDVELPILGVFVWQEGVEIDYRMGQEWGPSQVGGFFELLRNCCALDSNAVIVPADSEGPPYPDRFVQGWAFYNRIA